MDSFCLETVSGSQVPAVGMGTYLPPQLLPSMVCAAFDAGYRLFDTADDYGTEDGTGDAVCSLIQNGKCKREDLFLQTKVSNEYLAAGGSYIPIYFNNYFDFMQSHSTEEIVREKVETSLRKMRTDYLDSVLIHWMYPDYFVDIWKALIKLKKEGKIRYIGVSNCREVHFAWLEKETGVFPEINQIYISPIGTKTSLINYCKEKSCLVQVYSPLIDLPAKRLDVDVILSIAKKYHKSVAQVILRWNVERGCIPLPRTKNPARLIENMNIFDFSLSRDEVKSISSLNRDYQYIVESTICPDCPRVSV